MRADESQARHFGMWCENKKNKVLRCVETVRDRSQQGGFAN